MRHLQTTVAVVFTAVALTALVGVSSASATALYSSGTKLSQGSLIETTGAEIIFKAGFATIQCSHSEASGKTATTGGSAETVELPVSNWAVQGCNSTWTTLKTGKWVFHWTSGTNGTVTSEGWEWTIATGGISCVYGTPSATNIGTLTGGNPATLHFSATLTRISGGFLCANPATMTATYTFTNPTPLHATKS